MDADDSQNPSTTPFVCRLICLAETQFWVFPFLFIKPFPTKDVRNYIPPVRSPQSLMQGVLACGREEVNATYSTHLSSTKSHLLEILARSLLFKVTKEAIWRKSNAVKAVAINHTKCRTRWLPSRGSL